MIDLSVITVTYQSKEYIGRCILSVMTRSFKCASEHIIVDNGSTDGTVEAIEEEYGRDVLLIKNTKNMGFAAANNQAVKVARGRFLLFLNPDMEIYEGRLDDLLDHSIARSDVGIVGCKLLSCNRCVIPKLRPLKFPSFLPYIPSFLKIKPFFCSVHENFYYPGFDDDLEQEVETVRGAFMLMRKETIERLSFAFDPRYFILWEDVDLCREMQRLGLKVIYSPRVSCLDHFGRSFSSQTKAWKYCQMAKSFLAYVRKWHSSWHLLWLYLLIPIGFLLRIYEWGVKESIKALRSSFSLGS